MQPPASSVQLGRFSFQFLIEVLSSAHAKTWFDSAAGDGGRVCSGKKGRAGYSRPGAIAGDDRAVRSHSAARGPLGTIRRRSQGAGKTGGGRQDRKYHFHAAILEWGPGHVSGAAEGADAAGAGAAGLFLDQQGPVVRNR